MFGHKKKNMGLTITIFVLIVISLFFVLKNKGVLGNDGHLLKLIEGQEKMVELFNKAKDGEAKLAADPEKISTYFTVALDWKSIAEQTTGEKNPFFERALRVYEQGIEKFGSQNVLFYLNGGKIAERMEDYQKAENYFQKAIEISPADESGYLNLVDLYYYRMNKGKEDILPMLQKGIDIMVTPLPLISGRATYLRRIDEWELALEDYKVLKAAYPHHAGYSHIVDELEKKIAEQD